MRNEESFAFLWCKMTHFGLPMMQNDDFCVIGEPNFRKKYRALPSQGKMREGCTIIKKYYWVSIYTKINANRWSTPLRWDTKAIRKLYMFSIRLILLMVGWWPLRGMGATWSLAWRCDESGALQGTAVWGGDWTEVGEGRIRPGVLHWCPVLAGGGRRYNWYPILKIYKYSET